MTDPVPTISIQIPEASYRRLRRVAEITHRPVEEVLATAINIALPQPPDLPADLADDLAAMTMFNDESLWAASESSLSPAQRRRLSQLTHAGGLRALTASESAELAHLSDLYDRSVLRRARALAILAHRGYPVPDRKATTPSTSARRAATHALGTRPREAHAQASLSPPQRTRRDRFGMHSTREAMR